MKRQRPHHQEHERKLGSPDDGQPRATRSHGGSPQELLIAHALIQILVILHALLIVQHAPLVPQRRNPDGTRRQNADPQVAQQLQRQENPQHHPRPQCQQEIHHPGQPSQSPRRRSMPPPKQLVHSYKLANNPSLPPQTPASMALHLSLPVGKLGQALRPQTAATSQP